MKNCIYTLLLIIFCGICTGKNDLSLTIYQDRHFTVRESRDISFEPGINVVVFEDVARDIDPETAMLKCEDGLRVLEQRFQRLARHDMLKPGDDVRLQVKGGGADTGRNVTGKLVWRNETETAVIDHNGYFLAINNHSIESISLKEKANLTIKPNLIWLIQSEKSGTSVCTASYSAYGIGWNALYNAVLSPNETQMSFSGWVSIEHNITTAAFNNAGIKLVAGSLRRQQPQPMMMKSMATRAAGDMAMEASAPQFEEAVLSEYHIYKLGRRVDIGAGETKQIQLIEQAPAVSLEKRYVYNHRRDQQNVRVEFEFVNSDENGLGIPIPAGKVRISKADSDGELEFLGEDMIGHTPADANAIVVMGSAFDIKPEYKLLNRAQERRQATETHEVTLINSKDEAVTVFVDEWMSGSAQWSVDEASHEWKKEDANTARFIVPMEPNSKETVTYTITQKW